MDIITTTQNEGTSRTDTRAGREFTKYLKRDPDSIHESFDDLYNHVKSQRHVSRQGVTTNRQLEFVADPSGADTESLLVRSKKTGQEITPTHWSFGQLAQRCKAPAAYLRTLPAQIIADNLNYGLNFNREIDSMGLLVHCDQDTLTPHTLAAATGEKYGRIWNQQILDGLLPHISEWTTPTLPSGAPMPCYFASDRDMFIFMQRKDSAIQVDNRRNGQAGAFYQGFYAWNSEVGSATAGFALFGYDATCGNRWVYGQKDYQEVRIRHTSKAQDRFTEEMLPSIAALADSRMSLVDMQIKAAQEKTIDDMADFMKNRYGAKNATKFQLAFESDEQRPMESLWDIGTGITAHARTIKNNDERIKVEMEAGKLLELATR